MEVPEQQARDLMRVSYGGKIERMLDSLSVDR